LSKIINTIKKEVREIIPTMIFFLIIFHISALTRLLMLKSYGITITDSIFATVSALIVSKAILIANKLRFVKRFEARPLLYNILWKVLVFSLFNVLFRLIEELISLLIKYGSPGSAGKHLIDDMVWTHFWAIQIWLFLSLVLYCSVVELIRVLGAEKVREMFLGRRNGA
jgi:hypothetical protein